MSAKDEGRLGRWSRLKRKRRAGEDVNEPDKLAEADDASAVAARGAARPVAPGDEDGPDQLSLKDGKPYLPPLAADSDDEYIEPAVSGISVQGAGEPVNAGTQPGQSDDPDARPLTEEEQELVEALPPIEELNKESDFTPFLNKKIPEFIRRKALRKLWLSDPAFGFLDGMNEYDEDYSVAAELVAGASDYRPDKGGYSWKNKPDETEDDETEDGDEPAAQENAAVEGAGDDGEVDEFDESLAEKARRVQDRGGSSVRSPEYTANPYYQAPGHRDPIPAVYDEPSEGDPEAAESVEKARKYGETEEGAGGAQDDDDELGDGEDDFG